MYTTGFFSPHFQQTEKMNLPEFWVILILVELFQQNALVTFAKHAWDILGHENFQDFEQSA